jgi:signal transduction histidine kinase
MRWLAGGRRGARRERAASAFVLAGLTAFVVLVYVVVVLGVGAAIGRTSPPSLLLSVVATVLVALAFDPVQTWLERVADRVVVHRTAPAPDEVWARFASTVTARAPASELPSRMARVLAEGTAAHRAEVWVVVQGRPMPAATWPPGIPGAPPPGPDPRDSSPGRRTCQVRHAGELLGFLVVQEREPLTAVEERLFRGLAAQAGLVLRSARLRVELEQRVAELSRTAEELTASRQRLVDVQDERRRLLERDIHDGAQQHLVALAVNLRLAQRLLGTAPDRGRALLREQRRATREATDTLVRLSRGIYPPLLGRDGLVPALRAEVSASPVPVTIEARGGHRHEAAVEAAAYFCCLEAVQNASKHADAAAIRICIESQQDELVLEVHDDGRGFDPAGERIGEGLANIRDRVESLGGRLTTESAPGRGTLVRAVLPARAPLGQPGGQP